MALALDTPNKEQKHLVTFTWGDPVQVKRYTNWDSNIDPQGLNFVSLPRMEIVPAKNEGTFGEEATRIKMQIETLTTALLDPLTRGTPFAPVAVTVEEIIDPANIGDSGSAQFIAAGTIYRTRKNANGKTGLVIIEVRSRKTLLDVALGFQVNAQCVWRLNGPGCNEATHSPSGYATIGIAIAIDGKVISINDVGLNFDLAGTRSWTRGFIRRDNVNIGIFFYDKATFDGLAAKEFQLVRQAPDEWEGQQVTFFPGCNKEPGDGGCGVTAWDVLEGFGGSGHAIPSYHPVTENPQGS